MGISWGRGFLDVAMYRKRRRNKKRRGKDGKNASLPKGHGGNYDFQYRLKSGFKVWFQPDPWHYWNIWGSDSQGPNYQYQYDSLELSRSNPKKKGYYVDGGDFYVWHQTCKFTNNSQAYRIYSAWNNQTVVHGKPSPSLGGRANSIPAPANPDIKKELDSLATQYFATGVARTNPVQPEGNLAQAIIEAAKGGLSGVGSQLINWRNTSSRATLLGAAGGEWLNLQFAVLPTVEDAVKAVHVLLNIQTMVDKLRKYEGKPRRRRKTLLDTTKVSTTFDEGWGYCRGYNGGLGAGGDMTPDCRSTVAVTTIVREKVWFVGKYVYYLPTGTFSDQFIRARVGGIIPTLHTAWQVTNWSWLAGWFSNINDVIRNISDNVGEKKITLYSYLMKEVETREIYTYTSTGLDFEGNKGYPTNQYYYSGDKRGPVRDTGEYKFITRMRVGGRSPYGLYVGLPELTAWQTSILAALGLSFGGKRSK